MKMHIVSLLLVSILFLAFTGCGKPAETTTDVPIPETAINVKSIEPEEPQSVESKEEEEKLVPEEVPSPLISKPTASKTKKAKKPAKSEPAKRSTVIDAPAKKRPTFTNFDDLEQWMREGDSFDKDYTMYLSEMANNTDFQEHCYVSPELREGDFYYNLNGIEVITTPDGSHINYWYQNQEGRETFEISIPSNQKASDLFHQDYKNIFDETNRKDQNQQMFRETFIHKRGMDYHFFENQNGQIYIYWKRGEMWNRATWQQGNMINAEQFIDNLELRSFAFKKKELIVYN